MSTIDDESQAIACSKHGRGTAAIVCQHHVLIDDRSVGFVENSSDPKDLQAWCDQCEAVFLEEGDKTERFRTHNGMTVVCVRCYEQLKLRHSAR
jgi:hypothetical protein